MCSANCRRYECNHAKYFKYHVIYINAQMLPDENDEWIMSANGTAGHIATNICTWKDKLRRHLLIGRK